MSGTPVTKVTLMGMDARARELLEMFLQGPAGGACVVVPADEAELAIIDLDGPDPRRKWQEAEIRFAGPKLILSSASQETFPAEVVRKPLQPQTFLQALEKARTGEASPSGTLDFELPPAGKTARKAEHNEAGNRTAGAPVPMPSLPPIEPAGSCCGELEDEAYEDPLHRNRIFYQPGDFLQGVLMKALSRSRHEHVPVRIEGLGPALVVDAAKRSIHTRMREQMLRSMCRLPLGNRPLDFHLLEAPVEIEADAMHHALEPLLWNVTLWCARGRVPQGTDLHAPVRLYPLDPTRLPPLPNGLRIARLWLQEKTSLLETPARLDLHFRNVFSFYSAADTLGYVEHHPEQQLFADEPREKGLLARLLGRRR